MMYLIKNKVNLRTFNLQIHFKERIMFLSWGWPIISTPMEAEGSLSCLQNPETDPCSNSDESSRLSCPV